jgi:thiamine-phosphate pyrophosphorylase
MASRTAADTPAPRLYLLTPVVEDADAFARPLEAALEGVDIAAVLLRIRGADERQEINIIKRLAPVVQSRGIALLIDGNPSVSVKGGADGAHLSGDAFAAGLSSLKPARIAGAGGLKSKHEAMEAAESGADYVMFGEPDANGVAPPREAACERLAWWSEVFQIPCVGYAGSADAVADISAAGADFVALGDYVWNDERGPAAAILAAAAAMKAARPAVEPV